MYIVELREKWGMDRIIVDIPHLKEPPHWTINILTKDFGCFPERDLYYMRSTGMFTASEVGKMERIVVAADLALCARFSEQLIQRVELLQPERRLAERAIGKSEFGRLGLRHLIGAEKHVPEDEDLAVVGMPVFVGVMKCVRVRIADHVGIPGPATVLVSLWKVDVGMGKLVGYEGSWDHVPDQDGIGIQAHRIRHDSGREYVSEPQLQ